MAVCKKCLVIFVFLMFQITPFCDSLTLSTSSRWIVDQSTGRRVKLACVNWVSHLEPMIPEGLEKKPLKYIAAQIRDARFNCVRFTWPTFMFTRTEYGNLTVSQSLDKFGLKAAKAGISRHNRQFLDMNVVSVHQAAVDELARHDLMVVLDNHISEPKWCCSGKDGNGFFGDDSFDPKEWLLGLQVVAKTYKNHPGVIGMSMRNELRGPHENVPDWYTYMEEGARTIHKENPDFLVIVSGLHYDSKLPFLKFKPFGVNLNNKLVFEAHWYAIGNPTDKWVSETNGFCAEKTKLAEDNYLFLIRGDNPFPLILSEFGIDQTGGRDADNMYISCLLAAVSEKDMDWALWTFQGSYIFRQGKVNSEESYGVTDLNWDRPKNPGFLDRLQLLRQINQDPKSSRAMDYIMYHPLSGLCAQIGKGNNVVLGNCRDAARWNQHEDDGPLKQADSPLCLGVGGEGVVAHVSNKCESKWKYVSRSGLHLASEIEQGGYVCLEKNDADDTIVTKKCLCVDDNLIDLPSCAQNPEVQWFKLVPTNV